MAHHYDSSDEKSSTQKWREAIEEYGEQKMNKEGSYVVEKYVETDSHKGYYIRLTWNNLDYNLDLGKDEIVARDISPTTKAVGQSIVNFQ